MKILLVTTSYPRNSEDMSGVFVKRLAASMARRGAKITVLAPGDRDAKSEEMDDGICIVRFTYAPRFLMRIAYGTGGLPENLKNYPYLYFILPFFIISLILNGVRLAKHCDLIHANWLFTGMFLMFAKKIWKKPMVVTLRGSDFKQKTKLFDFVLNKANAVTTVNQQWTEDLQKKREVNAFYTPNGVEVLGKTFACRERFGFSSQDTIVLSAGMLGTRKGTDLIVKTAKITAKCHANIRFVIAGPGEPEKFNIREMQNILYLGTIPPDQIFDFYAAGDIFFLPSRHEGRPNALLEAMASGLPAVATKLPGVLEVLTDESGIMVDVEDVNAAAEAICELANHPEKRKRMGKKAKDRIKELSLDWDKSASIYLNIFEEILSCAE